jgi:hypothetical protein
MRQERTRLLSVWQTCGINLSIVAAIVVVALAQYSGLTETLSATASDVTQMPIPTSTVSGAATLRPTPTAAAHTHTPTVTVTPTATRAHTPTAVTTRAQPPTALATSTPIITTSWPITQVLGDSTLGWPIETYQFGDGPIRLAFVGGIHGGYEWNSILLAYEAIDYFTAHPEQVPESISLYIIPSANPDGQVRVLSHAGRFTANEVPTDTVPGRFNGNKVDLNRNWGQNWTPVGTWRDTEISGGDAPFSEVETQILRDFLRTMDAVVFWHSARPGVYAASCDDVYPPSQALAAVYAQAVGYPLYEDFYDYAVTGNATDWLACAGVPAIAVELTNHVATEGARNLAAMQAVIDAYGGAEGP